MLRVGIRSVSTTYILRRIDSGMTIRQVAKYYNTTVECVRKQVERKEFRDKYGTRTKEGAEAFEAAPKRVRQATGVRGNTVHAVLEPLSRESKTVCNIKISGEWTLKKIGTEITCTRCRKTLGMLPRKNHTWLDNGKRHDKRKK